MEAFVIDGEEKWRDFMNVLSFLRYLVKDDVNKY